jgi:hypothetical protein
METVEGGGHIRNKVIGIIDEITITKILEVLVEN